MSVMQRERARILALPRHDGPTPTEVEEIQERYCTPGAGGSLLPGQVYAMWEWQERRELRSGLLVSLGVGEGKSLVAMLVASEWHLQYDTNSMILIPAALHRQLWTQHIPWARERFAVSCPIVAMGGKPKKVRAALAKGARGCFLMPYSLLSQPDGRDLLEWIDPDLVIADEAHLLRSGTSARTRRFWDWARARDRAPVGVAMSGTLTTRSLLDYWELGKWALGEDVPYPRHIRGAEIWASALDSDRSRWIPHQAAREMRGLLPWAQVQKGPGRIQREAIQRAYAVRLRSAPGYVPPGEGSIPTGLTISNREVPDPPSELLGMIREIEEDWIDPDGDAITTALQKHARIMELSAGIYLRRVWPDRPGVAQARAAWEAEQEWLKAHGRWVRSRRVLPRGLDTPGTAQAAMEEGRGGLPEDIEELWWQWQEAQRAVPEGAPGREIEVVRVSPYKVDAAVKWLSGRAGIIWVWHTALGDWVEERLRETDVPVLRKAAGDTWLRGDGSHKYAVVASISAHGTGRDLQDHGRQFVMQWPRSGQVMEQLLGRVHRTGQERDTLEVRTCLSTGSEKALARDCYRDTMYSARTMGGSRKLLLADYDPPLFTSVSSER